MVIEVSGPNGAGKTSLIKRLRSDYLSCKKDIDHKSAAFLFLFVKHLLLSLPGLLYVAANTQQKRLNKLKLLAFTGAYIDYSGRSNDTRIIDEGPIYYLSILDRKVPADNHWYLRWRDRKLKAYGKIVDHIIFVDVEADIAVKRIRERGRAHPAMRGTVSKAKQRINDHRRRVLNIIDELDDVSIIKVDTTDSMPEKIASEIYQVLAHHVS